MSDYIFDGTRQVAYTKDGFAFDEQQRKRYRVVGGRLLSLADGGAVANLGAFGVPGTVCVTGLLD